MKRVLMIVYYWPPAGGSGVQRSLYFAKYLSTWGWEPIVYAPENAEYPAVDESLWAEVPKEIAVIRQKVNEPYALYKKLTGKKPNARLQPNLVVEKNKGILEQMAVFVRGNFFIPDARKGWIAPSVAFLYRYLQAHPVDLIYSSSPPQSMHLIAMHLNQKTGIPFVADFRDPWTRISYFERLKLTPWARKKHHALEKEVLTKAAAVVTVSEIWKKDFEHIAGRAVHCITNGFDGEAFAPEQSVATFRLTYVGTLVADRVPAAFWQELKAGLETQAAAKNYFQLHMIGPVEAQVFEDIRQAGLDAYLHRQAYLAHAEVMAMLRESYALLLIGIRGEQGVLPGKLFEYLQSGRPILSLAEENSATEHLLREAGNAFQVSYQDLSKARLAMATLAKNFLEKKPLSPPANVEQYSRKSLTGKLAEVFNQSIAREK